MVLADGAVPTLGMAVSIKDPIAVGTITFLDACDPEIRVCVLNQYLQTAEAQLKKPRKSSFGVFLVLGKNFNQCEAESFELEKAKSDDLARKGLSPVNISLQLEHGVSSLEPSWPGGSWSLTAYKDHYGIKPGMCFRRADNPGEALFVKLVMTGRTCDHTGGGPHSQRHPKGMTIIILVTDMDADLFVQHRGRCINQKDTMFKKALTAEAAKQICLRAENWGPIGQPEYGQGRYLSHRSGTFGFFHLGSPTDDVVDYMFRTKKGDEDALCLVEEDATSYVLMAEKVHIPESGRLDDRLTRGKFEDAVQKFMAEYRYQGDTFTVTVSFVGHDSLSLCTVGGEEFTVPFNADDTVEAVASRVQEVRGLGKGRCVQVLLANGTQPMTKPSRLREELAG